MPETTQNQKSKIITREQGNRITKVVVFSDQAHITRKASVQVDAGLNRILLIVQAFEVDPESAQALVRGEGSIISVQYKEVPIAKAPQEDVRQLTQKKEELTQQRQELVNGQKVLDKKSQFLDSFMGFAENQMPQEIETQFPSAEDLRSMLGFLDDSYRQINQEDDSFRKQINQINDEISLIDQRLKQIRPPQGAKQKGIEVVFESGSNQEVGIEISYVAGRASWEPVYKVDVPLDLSKVSMTLLARIEQKTGENWSVDHLTVSNAVPLRGTVLPELHSWSVDLPRHVVAASMDTVAFAGRSRKKMKRKGKGSEEELAGAGFEELSEAEAEPVADFVQAEEKELPLAFEYDLTQGVNIDSGHGEALLPLFTREMPNEFFAYAIPRLDSRAYLVCRATPDRALIAGRLNIHFGGRFVGQTTVTEKKPGEDLLINFGVDRGIKVGREKVTDKISETFFGVVDRGSVARELEFRIVLENLKEEPVRVHLLDHIPVSQTDRIQVKGLDLNPEPVTRDYQKREGVMLWRLDLDSRATANIHTKFFVKHPKDSHPFGL